MGALRARIEGLKDKTRKLEIDEPPLPASIDSYPEFDSFKLRKLPFVIQRVSQKLEETDSAVDKCLAEQAMNSSIILQRLKDGKEKFEVFGLLQRQVNIEDHLKRLNDLRTDLLMLESQIEDFTVFGDLCEDQEHC